MNPFIEGIKNNYSELFCFVVGLYGLYSIIRGFILIKSSALWEKTQGLIEKAEVRSSGETGYYPKLKYSYNVNGKTYYSNRIYPSGMMIDLSKEDAQEEIDSFKGNLIVYYDPKNPKNSCLIPGRGYLSILILSIATLIFLYGGFYLFLNK